MLRLRPDGVGAGLHLGAIEDLGAPHQPVHEPPARGLVVVEVTLALTLLVSAGLMLRSFVRLQNVMLGFEPEHVLTSQVSLPATRYGASVQRANFYSEALLRLQTVPGISDAAAVTQLPLSENNWAMEIALDGPETSGTPCPRMQPQSHLIISR